MIHLRKYHTNSVSDSKGTSRHPNVCTCILLWDSAIHVAKTLWKPWLWSNHDWFAISSAVTLVSLRIMPLTHSMMRSAVDVKGQSSHFGSDTLALPLLNLSTVVMHSYHAVLKVLDGFLPLVHHIAPNWFTACWSSLVHQCRGHINTATILWLLIIQGWYCKTVIKCASTSSQACNYQCCQ